MSAAILGRPVPPAEDAAETANIVTAWGHVRRAMAEGRILSADEEAAEVIVVCTPTVSPAGARAKLMLALDFIVTDLWCLAPIRADDLTSVYAREADLDLPARLIVGAIQALEGMSA